ncbi:hypothetical protein NDU88_002805 [Pleurodeles waltl]|uniref:Uncharacterized protein n=1 Tax=Pleurodeles waltl TaxID=8319 RepID=A0AAV7SE60_PLEWA|nr:hypothetical protein NDU88_002805 [Pleurodeles waltl]
MFDPRSPAILRTASARSESYRRQFRVFLDARGVVIKPANSISGKHGNVDHLIPLTVTVSYMHLANIKEMLMHGNDIYDEDTAVWKKDLEDESKTYKKDFEELHGQWRKWRGINITVTLDEYKSPKTIPPFFFFFFFTGDVDENVTREYRNFYTIQSTILSSPTYFKAICDTVKTMLWNRANGALLQTLAPTFFLDNFMPGVKTQPTPFHVE